MINKLLIDKEAANIFDDIRRAWSNASKWGFKIIN